MRLLRHGWLELRPRAKTGASANAPAAVVAVGSGQTARQEVLAGLMGGCWCCARPAVAAAFSRLLEASSAEDTARVVEELRDKGLAVLPRAAPRAAPWEGASEGAAGGTCDKEMGTRLWRLLRTTWWEQDMAAMRGDKRGLEAERAQFERSKGEAARIAAGLEEADQVLVLLELDAQERQLRVREQELRKRQADLMAREQRP